MSPEGVPGSVQRRWPALIAGVGLSLGMIASLAGPVASAESPSPASSVPPFTTAATVSPAKKKPKPKPIRNESFRLLGDVVPYVEELDDDGGRGTALNSFQDPLVGRLGDGTYIMIALRGTREKPYVAWRSRDFQSWERYAEYDCTIDVPVEGPCQGRMIGFQSMDDGRLRLFFLVMGPQEIRSVVTSDGVTWEQEWDVKLRGSDFPEMDSLEFAYIAQMPDGSWRLYITALDCDVMNLRGRPNCEDSGPDDDPFAPMPAARLAHTYVSASSPDGVTWTPDPGVRWQASKTNGSLQRIAARTTPSGKVQIISNDTSMHALTRTSFITLESDDGLTFRKVSDQQIEMSDPHFVTDPRGRTKIVSSATDLKSGIPLWEPIEVTWVANDARVDDLVFNSKSDFEQGCFTIRVRGAGQLRIGVTRWKGWNKPGSADKRLYKLSSTKLKAPGVIRVKIKQLDQRDPANVGREDFPRNVTITDPKSGVVRVIPMYWHGVQNRAAPTCTFKK